MEKFILEKLKDLEHKAQFRVEVSNRFAALKIYMPMWILIGF
jgi:hypothetical protein